MEKKWEPVTLHYTCRGCGNWFTLKYLSTDWTTLQVFRDAGGPENFYHMTTLHECNNIPGMGVADLCRIDRT